MKTKNNASMYFSSKPLVHRIKQIGPLLAIVLTLVACGSDKGSGNDDPPSSSSLESSSSSEPASSSSLTPSSSSGNALVPASFDELPAVIAMEAHKGYANKLLLGEQGLYSRVYFDDKGSFLGQAVGTFTYDDNTGKASLAFVECLAVSLAELPSLRDTLCAANESITSLYFAIGTQDSSLYAGTAATQLDEVQAANLALNPVRIAEAGEIVGTWSHVKTTDTTRYWFWPNGDYRMQKSTASGSTIELGHFDVQNNYIITIPQACQSACFTAEFLTGVAQGGGALQLQSAADTAKNVFQPAETLPELLATEGLAKSWKVVTDTNQWFLDLSENSDLSLEVYNTKNAGALAYKDDGSWQVVGDHLLLDFLTGNPGCTGDQTVGAPVPNQKPSCFAQVLGTVPQIGADSISYIQDLLPQSWKKK